MLEQWLAVTTRNIILSGITRLQQIRSSHVDAHRLRLHRMKNSIVGDGCANRVASDGGTAVGLVVGGLCFDDERPKTCPLLHIVPESRGSN